MIADASQRFLSGLKGVTRSGKTDVHYVSLRRQLRLRRPPKTTRGVEWFLQRLIPSEHLPDPAFQGPLKYASEKRWPILSLVRTSLNRSPSQCRWTAKTNDGWTRPEASRRSKEAST